MVYGNSYGYQKPRKNSVLGKLLWWQMDIRNESIWLWSKGWNREEGGLRFCGKEVWGVGIWNIWKNGCMDVEVVGL
jgi:hypothetical protein